MNSTALQNILCDQSNNALFLHLDGLAEKETVSATIYRLKINPDVEPLFHGTRYEKIQLHGPLLVKVSQDSELLKWFIELESDKVGLLLYASEDTRTKDFSAYLRPYLETLTPSGNKCLLRFYDPQIFKFFWPSLDPSEKDMFLGPAKGVAYCEFLNNGSCAWRNSTAPLKRLIRPKSWEGRPWVMSSQTNDAFHEPFAHSLALTLLETFKEYFPQRARTLRPDDRYAFARLAVEKCYSIGSNTFSELVGIMLCMAQLGTFFDTDPQYPWASLDLKPGETVKQRIKTISSKMEELRIAAWGDFGRPYQRTLRAVSLDFDPEWLSKIRTRQDALNLIPQLYREKARFQGTKSMEKLLDIATATGQNYRLKSMSSITVLMGVMFFLGTGVDKDPLFHWVGSLLQSEQQEEEKIRAILAMGRKRARSEYIIQRRITGIERYENMYIFTKFLSTASSTDLVTTPQELNTRYSLKSDGAAQECMEQSIARFSDNISSTCTH